MEKEDGMMEIYLRKVLNFPFGAVLRAEPLPTGLYSSTCMYVLYVHKLYRAIETWRWVPSLSLEI